MDDGIKTLPSAQSIDSLKTKMPPSVMQPGSDTAENTENLVRKASKDEIDIGQVLTLLRSIATLYTASLLAYEETNELKLRVLDICRKPQSLHNKAEAKLLQAVREEKSAAIRDALIAFDSSESTDLIDGYDTKFQRRYTERSTSSGALLSQNSLAEVVEDIPQQRNVVLQDIVSGQYLSVQRRQLVFSSALDNTCHFSIHKAGPRRYALKSCVTDRYVGISGLRNHVQAKSKSCGSWQEIKIYSIQVEGPPTFCLFVPVARWWKGAWLSKTDNQLTLHPASRDPVSINHAVKFRMFPVSDKKSASPEAVSSGTPEPPGSPTNSERSYYSTYSHSHLWDSGHSTRSSHNRNRSTSNSRAKLRSREKEPTNAEVVSSFRPPTPTCPWINELFPGFFESKTSEFKEVYSDRLALNSKKVFEHFYSSESAFNMERHEGDGNSDVDVSSWYKHPEFGKVRKQTFVTPVSGVPGVKTTRVKEYQTCTFADDEKSMVFRVKTHLQDIPYGSYFSVESETKYVDCGPNECTIVVLTSVHFTKSTLFKSSIINGTLTGAKKSSAEMADTMKQMIQELTSEHGRNSKELERLSSSFRRHSRVSYVAADMAESIKSDSHLLEDSYLEPYADDSGDVRSQHFSDMKDVLRGMHKSS